VLANLAYHIIDKKKNPGAERKEAPSLSLPLFLLGRYATNPL
jgi:hypothetical protein